MSNDNHCRRISGGVGGVGGAQVENGSGRGTVSSAEIGSRP
jgi:hypothetical protein